MYAHTEMNYRNFHGSFYSGVANIPIGIAVARKREDLKKDETG